jgi:hypothetical protein
MSSSTMLFFLNFPKHSWEVRSYLIRNIKRLLSKWCFGIFVSEGRRCKGPAYKTKLDTCRLSTGALELILRFRTLLWFWFKMCRFGCTTVNTVSGVPKDEFHNRGHIWQRVVFCPPGTGPQSYIQPAKSVCSATSRKVPTLISESCVQGYHSRDNLTKIWRGEQGPDAPPAYTSPKNAFSFTGVCGTNWAPVRLSPRRSRIRIPVGPVSYVI